MPSTARARACTPTSIAKRVRRSSSRARRGIAWEAADAIGIRPDSHFTAPEPELAIVIGPGHSIFGLTLANDVSAWDIERENALYLTQSKVYDRCCALGPVIVTMDEIADPYRLQMTCTVKRAGNVLFEGTVNTAKLHRRLETLVEYLTRANRVPTGTVLLTGTGIIVPQEAALARGRRSYDFDTGDRRSYQSRWWWSVSHER